MSGKIIKEEVVPERIPEGLRDGGHTYINCSNCRAILLDVFVTRPHEPDVWKVKATCPFCGDESFIHEIQGGFHAGGFGVIKPDNVDDDIPSTIVSDIEIGDCIVYRTAKANPGSKPAYRL